MKKNLLPLLLIAGAALAFMAFRKKGPKVLVTAESPEVQSATEFEADYQQSVQPKPSVVETAASVIKTIFPKKTAKQKTAIQAQKLAVKRAKSTGITKKQAKAGARVLSKGIPKIGFSDDNVLV